MKPSVWNSGCRFAHLVRKDNFVLHPPVFAQAMGNYFSDEGNWVFTKDDVIFCAPHVIFYIFSANTIKVYIYIRKIN